MKHNFFFLIAMAAFFSLHASICSEIDLFLTETAIYTNDNSHFLPPQLVIGQSQEHGTLQVKQKIFGNSSFEVNLTSQDIEKLLDSYEHQTKEHSYFCGIFTKPGDERKYRYIVTINIPALKTPKAAQSKKLTLVRKIGHIPREPFISCQISTTISQDTYA